MNPFTMKVTIRTNSGKEMDIGAPLLIFDVKPADQSELTRFDQEASRKHKVFVRPTVEWEFPDEKCDLALIITRKTGRIKVYPLMENSRPKFWAADGCLCE